MNLKLKLAYISDQLDGITEHVVNMRVQLKKIYEELDK